MPSFFKKIGRETARITGQIERETNRVVERIATAVDESKIEREVKRIGGQIEEAARGVKQGYQEFNQQPAGSNTESWVVASSSALPTAACAEAGSQLKRNERTVADLTTPLDPVPGAGSGLASSMASLTLSPAAANSAELTVENTSISSSPSLHPVVQQ